MKKANFQDLFEKRAPPTKRAETQYEIIRATRFAEALIVCNMVQIEAWIMAFGQVGVTGKPANRRVVATSASRYAETPLVKRILRDKLAELYGILKDPKTGAVALLKNCLRANELDLWDDDGKIKSIPELRELPMWYQLLIQGMERYETKNGETRHKVKLMSKNTAIDQLSALLNWADTEVALGSFTIADLVEDADLAKAEAARLLSDPNVIDGEYERV